MKTTPNVILKGKLHKENNNIGDKGVIVTDDDGVKEFEFEKEELVLSVRLTSKINALVDRYNTIKDVATEIELGQLLTEQILFNTEDKSELYNTTVKDG